MKVNKSKTLQGEAPKLQELNVGGDIYYTTFTRKYENRQPWSRPNDKEVISYIPGTIRQVLVKEGDTVEAGQKLLVLEAMKMMNIVYSPITGRIKSVLVKPGDRQPKGMVMIVFE
jgi:biotin carboxyl carrier protein